MPVNSKRQAESGAIAGKTWTAPKKNEYLGMKRFKSFLLPPQKSYALGDFVWIQHQDCSSLPSSSASSSSSSLPPSKRRRTTDLDAFETRHSASPLPDKDGVGASGENGGGVDAVAQEGIEADKRWEAGLWLGKIIEIRAKDKYFVWMKIRWTLSSVNELREHGIRTGLPKVSLGGGEIFMLGPEFDALQPVGAVESCAPVVLFDESNPMQTPFDDRAVFYRSEGRTPSIEEAHQLFPKKLNHFEVGPSKSRKSLPAIPGHLFPYHRPTCYCGKPYDPLIGDSQALCPHPDCLRWFHLGCLDWRDIHIRPAFPAYLESIRSSGMHLLGFPSVPSNTPPEGSWLARGGPVEADTPASPGTSGGRRDSKVTRAAASQPPHLTPSQVTALEARQAVDAALPQQIRQAADAPIVRGGADGVVGNGRMVVEAREVVAVWRAESGLSPGLDGGDGPVSAVEEDEGDEEAEDQDVTDVDAAITTASASRSAQALPSPPITATLPSRPTLHLPHSAEPTKPAVVTPSTPGTQGAPPRLAADLSADWMDKYGEVALEEPRGVVWMCPGCKRAM